MKRTACFCSLLLALLTSQSLLGQAGAGRQNFGTFGGGPVDSINLGTLNVHLAVPIRHKAGRGLPFTYDLTYDSTIWSPVGISGSQTWQPWIYGSYWGWQNLLSNNTGGSMSYSTSTTGGACGQFGQYTWTQVSYTNWVYSDFTGSHPFNGFQVAYVSSNGPGGQCPPTGPQPSTPLSQAASDLSGITLNGAIATPSSVTWNSVSLPNGYQNFAPGSTSFRADANGNEITTTAGPVYTDTLGQTALTVAGGTPPTATTFKYAAPSGAQATYSVSYKSYTVTTNFGCTGVSEYTQSPIYLVDKITLPDSTLYQFQYEATVGGGANVVTGRLSQVTLPTGGTVSYAYPVVTVGGVQHNGINCADGTAPTSSSSLTRTVSPGGTWTYSRTQVSGKHWQTTVSTPPDPTTPNQTVIDFQQDSNSTGNFYETQRQVNQGSSTLLSTSVTCYNGSGTLTPFSSACQTSTAVFAPPTRLTNFTCLPSCSGKVAETDVSYGYIGVPGYETEVDSYDYGAGTPGSLLRKVVTTYGSYRSIVRPTSVQVQDASSAIKSSTTYSYDETAVTTTTGTPNLTTPLGGTSRGNLTTIATKVSGTVTLYRKFTYFDTGNLGTATDAGTTSAGGPNSTTYTYGGCSNSFLSSVSVAAPLSLSRSFTWDCGGGVQTSVTDENGQVSTAYFAQTSTYGSPDTRYWRPYATTDPLTNVTTLAYPSATVAESAMLFNSNHSVVDQRSKVDVFGRPYLNQVKEGPSSSTYDLTETDYDTLGRPQKSVLPFTASADTACTGGCSGITATYDALYRPLTRTDSGGGTVSFTYTANDTLQVTSPAPTGENTKQRQYESNGLGWLSWVCEVTSASGSGACGTGGKTGFWTKYTYDTNGNMTIVTQNAQAASGSQQTRTYVYDMIGRLTSESNPETGSTAITYAYDSLSSDASCGTVTSAGDLLKKTDAMGNVTCFTYDALHRVTAQKYTGTYASVTDEKHFVYDAATVNSTAMANAKTRLAEAYTCTGTCSSKKTDLGFSYTARGETSDVLESTPDSGRYYHVNATYWANGRLNVLNGGTGPLPGLPAITYGAMDGKGRITGVTASSGQNPVNSISWNTGNQVTGVTFGSLDSDSYQYDPNTGRMTQYKFNMGTGPQSQTGALTWNANSTLKQLQITDQINTANSQTCTYAYDDLTRITSDNCASVWSQTFALDPFGNLKKSGSATFTPTYTGDTGTGVAPLNQYYQISGGGSGASNYYDANGNLKNDVTHTYTWDADGNMLSTGGSTVTMMYDALDRMIEQTSGSNHTEIVYGPYGMKLALMNGASLVNAFVKLPGGARAVYGASGLAYYRHADHLGSSRLATTPTRTKYYDVAYAPYGEDYNGSGTQDLAFTDENQDTVKNGWSSNLYDFMLREYRTAHGRWTSPDPAGLGAVDPTNPQTWNRYAYVLNNPMAMVDLLGDDGCYDSNGGDLGVADMNCYSAGGIWLGGGAYVQNGQTYLSSELVGVQMIQVNGATVETDTILHDVAVGSFSDLFGWQFQNGNPANNIVNAIPVGGNAGNAGCPSGVNCGSGQGGGNNGGNGQPNPPTNPRQNPPEKVVRDCHRIAINGAIKMGACVAALVKSPLSGTICLIANDMTLAVDSSYAGCGQGPNIDLTTYVMHNY